MANCGFQCGFCTPGFILMTEELLRRRPNATEDEIRHYLSGNLCRCASYPGIVKAVSAAIESQRSSTGPRASAGEQGSGMVGGEEVLR
jgi:aerobic-type carbon monoxide dehydrogenase small subunit (CoxS/CutS family)